MPRARYKQKPKPPAWWIERQRAVARTREAQATREPEGLRKRYQCDLLQFWRRCADTRCRRKRTCKGDPDGCLGRGLAAMPEEHREWLRGAIMATVKGARTREGFIRMIDEEIAAARRAKPKDLQELAAELKSMLSAERQAAGPSPSRQADEQADEMDPPGLGIHVSDEADTIEWSPMTGSSVDPVRAPAVPPPAASPGIAPQNPLHACCDEQGRLIIPDLTEYNERVRRGLSWDEIVRRGRV